MENILKTIPGVNTWEALSGFRRVGFLEYVGELWRRYGDVFQIKVFNRHMVVAMLSVLASRKRAVGVSMDHNQSSFSIT